MEIDNLQDVYVIIAGLFGILTTLVSIVYQVLNKRLDKIDEIDERVQKQRVLKAKIERVSSKLNGTTQNIDKNLVTGDMCEARRKNIRLKLKQMSSQIDDICEKVDNMRDEMN